MYSKFNLKRSPSQIVPGGGPPFIFLSVTLSFWGWGPWCVPERLLRTLEYSKLSAANQHGLEMTAKIRTAAWTWRYEVSLPRSAKQKDIWEVLR